MASLSFQHPHTEINVNDNSETYESATGIGTTAYIPYISDKGEDNVVEKLTDLTTFLSGKGIPNFKKHGQSIYNLVNWLRNGGIVYGMRLLPEDATLANTVLNVKTKQVKIPVYKKKPDGSFELDSNNNRIPEMEADGTTPKTQNGVDIKLIAETVTNLNSKSNVSNQVESMPSIDADGYSNHRIMAVYTKGRGDYGSKFSYRLSLNTTFEDTYDFRVYDLTVLERTKNGNLRTVEGPFSVSMFPEAINLAQSSMFIDQVVRDYCKEIEVLSFDRAYDDLLDDLVEATKDANGESIFEDTAKEIDFLFGRDKTNKLYEIVTLENSTLTLDQIEGVKLENGSDGSFGGRTSSSARRDAITDMYVKAYSGLIDSSILNRKKYPINIAIDANLPLSVKNAIVDFCTERRTTLAIIDAPVSASSAVTINWRKNQFQKDSYILGVFGQSYVVNDSFTLMDIPVTQSYMLSSKIPFNDTQYGVQFPFVGPNRGLITNFKSLDWNPDEYEKEDLYKNRINYVEQDFRNTKLGTQLTAQYKTSALSNINNVRILMEMITKIEDLSENYKFEFPNQSTLNNFNENLANIFTEYTNNGSAKSATATAYQNEYDMAQKIARVKLDVVFMNVIERIVIDINVGK